MKPTAIQKEQKPEMSEAVKRFTAIPPEKQETALLILRGIQIGEKIAPRFKKLYL